MQRIAIGIFSEITVGWQNPDGTYPDVTLSPWQHYTYDKIPTMTEYRQG